MTRSRRVKSHPNAQICIRRKERTGVWFGEGAEHTAEQQDMSSDGRAGGIPFSSIQGTSDYNYANNVYYVPGAILQVPTSTRTVLHRRDHRSTVLLPYLFRLCLVFFSFAFFFSDFPLVKDTLVANHSQRF